MSQCHMDRPKKVGESPFQTQSRVGESIKLNEFNNFTPRKIDMLNPKSWRFGSDGFPFQFGDF